MDVTSVGVERLQGGPGGLIFFPVEGQTPKPLTLDKGSFSSALEAYNNVIRTTFMPIYRRWHGEAHEFFGEIGRKADAGEVTVTLEGGESRVSEHDNIKKFSDEKSVLQRSLRDELKKRPVPRSVELFLKMIGHRISNPLTTAINEYERRLVHYVKIPADERTDKDKPQLEVPTPEELEATLLKRAWGKFQKMDGKFFKDTLLFNARGWGPKSLNEGTFSAEQFAASGDVWVEFQFLQEVIRELASNASHFLPKEGGRITLAGSADENTVSFSVEDNGSGIAKENLPRIFQPGYTSRPRPVGGEETGGLGLSMIEGVVEHIFGGEITVESNGRGYNPKTGQLTESDMKQGTKFTFTYPNKEPQTT